MNAPPLKFIASETLKWSVSLADYPANDGWALGYEFRSNLGGSTGSFDAAGVANGSAFDVTVASAITAPLLAGLYSYRAFVTKGTEKFFVQTGTAEVSANFSATEAVDSRSIVKKTLDALEAMLQGKASLDQQRYTINNRSLDRYTPTELIVWHKHYLGLYAAEQRAEKLKSGSGFFKTIHTRFTEPR